MNLTPKSVSRLEEMFDVVRPKKRKQAGAQIYGYLEGKTVNNRISLSPTF